MGGPGGLVGVASRTNVVACTAAQPIGTEAPPDAGVSSRQLNANVGTAKSTEPSSTTLPPSTWMVCGNTSSASDRAWASCSRTATATSAGAAALTSAVRASHAKVAMEGSPAGNVRVSTATSIAAAAVQLLGPPPRAPIDPATPG